MKKKPDDPQLLMLLAQSYLKTEEKEKGIEISRKILEQDGSPNNLNSVAYFLADANVALDESLKWAQDAVQQEEARRLDVNLGEVSLKDTQHAGTLSAYWDTLGWVYFRKGNYVLAEKYLKASWGVSQDLVTGTHLSEVYEKQKKISLAAKTLAQAYAAGGFKNPETKKKLEQLVGRAQAGQLISRAGGELSQLRTIKFAAPGVGKVSSDFWVTLSPAKVEQVRVISTDAPEKLEKALMGAKFDMVFPSTNPVKLVRKGIVFCSGGPTCDAVVYPLGSSNP